MDVNMVRAKIMMIMLLGVAAVIGIIGTLPAQAQVGVSLPSTPGTPGLSSPAPFQVTVTWGASTETSGTIAGYYVYRNGAQVAATADTQITDAGLGQGYYSYSVAAYDANGVMSQQSPSASITLTADTVPPTAPSNLTVVGATTTNSSFATTTFTLSWAGSTDNVGVAGYRVFRNGTMINSATSSLTATGFTDTVLPGSYSYTVDAYDASLNYSAKSTPVLVTVNVDYTQPSTPTGVSAQQVAGDSVALTWQPSTDNTAVGGYRVFRNSVQVATTSAPSFTDTGLAASTTYSYSVNAFDIVGNTSPLTWPVPIILQPLNGIYPPYAIRATLAGPSSVQLVWAPALDALAVTSYSIYRNNIRIAVTGSSTRYLDQGLAPGWYDYILTATDISGAVSTSSATSTIIVPVPSTSTTPIVMPGTGGSGGTTSGGGNTGSSGSGISGISGGIFTQFLYYGLRSAQVKLLQAVLVAQGYLSPVGSTGFFGRLTLSALQKFQCAQNIVCTGGAGWGTAGPRTRAALNKLL